MYSVDSTRITHSIHPHQKSFTSFDISQFPPATKRVIFAILLSLAYQTFSVTHQDAHVYIPAFWRCHPLSCLRKMLHGRTGRGQPLPSQEKP